ncbi:ATP synthase F1 subunit delta [Buchnera aphidicola]|uniref:ATP synthase F1 subunit delta n=1 Tax=Buchnera aphidicola TaxID=9 RepID=UPI0034644F36
MQKEMDIARVYATAIFNFSIKKNCLQCSKNFLSLLYKIFKNKKINHFFFFLSDVKNIFHILEDTIYEQLNQNNKNFLNLLIYNKKLHLIKKIQEIFINLYNKHYNIITIHIITAININLQEKRKIFSLLEKKLCKKIHLRFKVRSSILNGMILKFQDTIIDDCILSRLKALSNFLLD